MNRNRRFINLTGKHNNRGVTAADAWQRLWEDLVSQGPVEDILLSEGKIYGRRYYTAEPIGGHWQTIEKWCSERFGTSGGAVWGAENMPEPAQRWYMNNRKFWFRDKIDRMIFVLKWR